MKLVIIESPGKAKKVQQHLGPGYEVMACLGHVRDLPEDELGVELEPPTYAPQYVVRPGKADVLAKLKRRAASAQEVLLATDPDREGEAIAWHLAQALRLRAPRRMRYTEITERALRAALGSAGPLDLRLVDAQQARRVVDRLVGYQVSPLLRPFGRNHSAGRVQTATLHLVAERARERMTFTSTPYWTLHTAYTNGLESTYVAPDAQGVLQDARLSSREEADAIAARAAGPHEVTSVETRPVERPPRPPFTTSTVLQAASTQLGMKPARASVLLQELYEAGLITYHRTDSPVLSDEAVGMARAVIGREYPEALPEKAPRYRAKGGAQEAHEAIRPTSFEADAGATLQGEQRALYDLIRSRALASQCRPAVFAETTVLLCATGTLWRARGRVLTFEGFLRFEPHQREAEDEGPEKVKTLPAVTLGERLAHAGVRVEARRTEPPPRFTEATLIREMERQGIGRPATYRPTIDVLFERDYIAIETAKALNVTRRGIIIDEALQEAFGDLVEPQYTAELEARLDDIAAGSRPWRAVVADWHRRFAQDLGPAGAFLAQRAAALRDLLGEDAVTAPRCTGRACPKCGSELLLKKGRKGDFLGCSGYPTCDYLADSGAPATRHEAPCPTCGGPTEFLKSPLGPWARCLDRRCKGKIDLSPEGGRPCPRCGAATRHRVRFLGCSRYPECRGTISLGTRPDTRRERPEKRGGRIHGRR